jgi:hypothetical protein
MISSIAAPFSSASSAVSREGAVADFIYTFSSAVAGDQPAPEGLAFSWQVLELDATFPEVLRPGLNDGDFPSRHALGLARSLCSDLDRILRKVISFSDLEAFEGDLLIHWRSGHRGVTLICPADSNRRAKLYREEIGPDRPLKTNISADPRASDLAREIQWVWNKD